ncbi:sulfite exporter TauE/SafE family protein [Candidatus Micrarchaeota archaeon]|nr:sulfite exporter TauE/SafE family protein [Candidatus Micrarchaeota archaeon]
MAEVTLVLAFIAGLVSFLSPCVLPLVPAFLSYLAGTSISGNTNRKELFLASVFFVLGFSAVFSILGVLLNTVLESVAYDAQSWLSRIGGIIIIFFGLYLVGLIKLSFLEKEHKIEVKQKFSSRYVTSFVFGAAFAAGWTPCVGAVLGGILALASAQPGSALGLLFAYSLGLGIPFLAVGAFASQAINFIKKFEKSFKYLQIIMGIVLIILGILVFTERLSAIANVELLNSVLLGE